MERRVRTIDSLNMAERSGAVLVSTAQQELYYHIREENTIVCGEVERKINNSEINPSGFAISSLMGRHDIKAALIREVGYFTFALQSMNSAPPHTTHSANSALL